jgi:hypothetical protein
MNSSTTSETRSVRVLRWSARLSSILVVGVVLVFVFGEGLNLSRFTMRELVLFLFFPFGVCLGMALAWRWEGLGGGVTVASLAAFYLVHRVLSPGFPKGLALVAMAAPGFLFLLCWWKEPQPNSRIANPNHLN